MCKPRTLIGLLAFCLLGICHESLAQSVPLVIDEETYGLTISSPKGSEVSPEFISNLSCTLTNNTSKQIVSYVVLWTLWFASGDKSKSITMADSSPINKASVLLQPNQSVQTDEGIETSSGGSSANPFVKVEVGIDYVLFADGSHAGKDTMKTAQQIRYANLKVRAQRYRLRYLYEEKGLEALLEAIGAIL